MALAVHLLGPPSVLRDGAAVAVPRGRKPWALLAYLLCSRVAPTREHLVSLLFVEADDPLGALRWNLTALRRLLGDDAVVGGDPVAVSLPGDTLIDVDVLAAGSWAAALELKGLGRPLLEGLDFPTSPAFDLWLAMERRHLEGTTAAVLHEAAQAKLAAHDARRAAELAARLVALDPFDENHRVLLVRSLAAAGDGIEAARQVARCRELFLEELGVEPGPALEEAAQTLAARPVGGPTLGRHGVRAQLEAGDAAIGAGAVDAGLQCLRRALVDARALGDPALVARALVVLGTALVHSARGRDEEAGSALHEALALADAHDLPGDAAAAARELGYVEMLRGRYDRAFAWLDRAVASAGDDQVELAAIGNVRGTGLTDTGRTGAAMAELHAACARGEAVGAPKLVAYASAMLGRAHLLRDELAEAEAPLSRALDIAEREWTSLVPYPLTLLGELAAARGDVDAAAERYERAFALGCQLGDPCWEGLAARGIGLLAAARGDVDTAVEWLIGAKARCMRLPDAWVWAKAYTLEALCRVGLGERLPAAGEWIAELEELAARCDMRELVARAALHRVRLTGRDEEAVAVALAADLDNPAVSALASQAR